ncbi:MAG: SLC13 family permease [Sphingomonadales bacterium]|nr:SLC13 family permease [Sphingomonadales bacterium]
MFTAFARGRMAAEIVSLLTICVIALGLYAFPMPGMSPKDGLSLAFEGFGHHALITICALMVLGRGLVVTGALDPATRTLTRVWRINRHLGLLVTLLLALFASMLINDTPVLVLLLPILVQLSHSGGMAASKTLIPVNAAILIGGMATTIGTSTNLLVISIANDLGMQPIGVFHYTSVVLAAALVALPYLWLAMPRLLPDNSPAAGHAPRRFEAALRFAPGSSSLGRTFAEIAANLPPDVTVSSFPQGAFTAQSVLAIIATPEQIAETARIIQAEVAVPDRLAELRAAASRAGEDIAVAEMVVAPDSRLIGHGVDGMGSRGVVIFGRDPVPARGLAAPAPQRATFGEGDVLLVMGTDDSLAQSARDDGLLRLVGGKDLPRTAKAPLALAIMLGAVGLASVGLVPIAISALAGAALMFVTGCVKFERVGRALSAQVIVLVAASLALGKLVLVSGAALWLGQVLAMGLQFLPAAGVLAAIMIFVTVLTNFASNATAAAVGTPIAFTLAQQLGLPVEPMVLAVLFGCNLCYATPVAYQTNMMILAEGNYVFRDYVRTGVPLVLLMIATLSTLLVWRYGL